MGTTLTAPLLPNPPPCSTSSIPYRKLCNTCRKLSLLLYLLMDPMTDIWLSKSQCAGAGMANLESEANLEVCARKRKNEGRRKKPAQIRAKAAELKWHSCPWSTVVVKTKKKMNIPLSVMNVTNCELKTNHKTFLSFVWHYLTNAKSLRTTPASRSC